MLATLGISELRSYETKKEAGFFNQDLVSKASDRQSVSCSFGPTGFFSWLLLSSTCPRSVTIFFTTTTKSSSLTILWSRLGI